MAKLTPWLIIYKPRNYGDSTELSLCCGSSPLIVFKNQLGVTTNDKMKNARFSKYFLKNYPQKSCKLPPGIPMNSPKCRKASKDNSIMIYIGKE